MDRVLIVSATMGEGHNATGRALEAAVRGLWPSATIGWLDALDEMGSWVGPLFRRIYVTNVRHTPWLYEYFYRALWRIGWFVTASKRFTSAWCGRRLARPIAAFAPDLVLSTYPMATGGLEWLRLRGRLDVPVGAWVSDFAPHPFWVYGSSELTAVMHDVAVGTALRCTPEARVVVSEPPVRAGFRPGDQDTARQRLNLPPDAFVALVSCGSLGFGDVEAAVAELLAAHPDVLAVAVCGRNERLVRRLRRLGEGEPRLHVVGWTDQMPAYVLASDVVVTNAGGATGLEALACCRPVLMHRPIAAHGRANAALMAEAGLAVVCDGDGELTGAVRELIAEPERLKTMAEAAARHCDLAPSLEDVLRMLANGPCRGTPEPLRPEDALFLHVQTAEVPQQVGAVLVFDPKPDGSTLTRADAAHLVAAAPGLHSRLSPATTWRRARRRAEPLCDADGVLTEVTLDGEADLDAALTEAMDAFFSVTTEPSAPCRARLVTGIEGDRAALLIALHHAASDGIAVVGALVGRARGKQPPVTPSAASVPDSRASGPRLRRMARLARGLGTLARGGRAPRPPWDTGIGGPGRHFSRVQLLAPDVRAVARELGVPTTDLVLGVVAEALHRRLGAAASPSLRAMVPMSVRDTGTFRQPGNHTGAVSVDLPTGPMTPRRRALATHEALRRQVAGGAPQAGHLVVRATGLLPPWLQRVVARSIYRGTWFNLIASVLPGARSPVVLNGALVRTVHPVLSLAPGVPLAVGVLTWADRFSVCVTSTTEQGADGDRLVTEIAAAFADLRSKEEA